MELDLDDGQLNKILSTAILEHLTPEAREKMIAKAIEEHLLAQEVADHRGQGRTRIQAAFDRAVLAAAEEMVREKLQTPGSVDRLMLERLVIVSLRKALDVDEHDGSILGDAIAELVAGAFTKAAGELLVD